MEASGEAPDDRVQDAVARSSAVKRYDASVWPPLDPAAMLHSLFPDAAALAAASADLLMHDEQRLLVWDKPAGARRHQGSGAVDAR